jgi:nicotinamide-nucleotide amidase
MRAVVITVGKELLMGKTVNGNLATIAEALSRLGIEVTRSFVIDDQAKDYQQVLDLCDEDLIVFTGGLGPTEDDLTKEVVFDYYDIEVELNKTVLDTIKGYFDRMNIEMKPSNVKQALLPKDGVILDNHRGTAPGIYFKHDAQHIVLFPGPPQEMEPMLNQVCDMLKTVLEDRVYSTGYKLVGVGESSLEDSMKEIYQMDSDVLVAPYASVGEIKYVFSSKNKTALNKVAHYFESKYGDYIYGNLDDTLEGFVVKLLANKGLTISMAESCTGGLLASRIVNVSGASTVFKEGFVTYSNASKMKHLKVQETTLKTKGAVSEQCAKEMVEGLYQATGCDVCVSITGIAGPNGGTKDKPVGLVYFGIRLNNEVKVHQRIFNGNREMVRYRATQTALDLIRKGLVI